MHTWWGLLAGRIPAAAWQSMHIHIRSVHEAAELCVRFALSLLSAVAVPVIQCSWTLKSMSANLSHNSCYFVLVCFHCHQFRPTLHADWV